MYLTTRHIGAIWNHIIREDLVAFRSEVEQLSLDTSGSAIVEIRPDSGLRNRPPYRLRISASGGLETLDTALSAGPDKVDPSEDGPRADSNTASLPGPSSKELRDRVLKGPSGVIASPLGTEYLRPGERID